MGKHIAMKRAWQVALWVLAICLFAVPVFAATTNLTTSVPYNVNIDLTIEGNGVVNFGDVVFKSSCMVELPKGENITVSANPGKGWTLQSAVIDGEDVKGCILEGKVTLENVTEDFSVSIIFQKTSDSPQTGDDGAALWLLLMCLSLTGTVSAVLKRKTLI